MWRNRAGTARTTPRQNDLLTSSCTRVDLAARTAGGGGVCSPCPLAWSFVRVRDSKLVGGHDHALTASVRGRTGRRRQRGHGAVALHALVIRHSTRRVHECLSRRRWTPRAVRYVEHGVNSPTVSVFEHGGQVINEVREPAAEFLHIGTRIRRLWSGGRSVSNQ